jgi:hypothetical protein
MLEKYVQCNQPTFGDCTEMLYRTLAEDLSAATSARQADDDSRFLIAIDSEDDNLLWNIGKLNDGRPAQLNTIKRTVMNTLKEHAVTAADDRRKSDEVHITSALFVPDLHTVVSSRLQLNALKPSVKWLAFQFWPKDTTLATAAQYTGRLKVKQMVQARQIRFTHPDSYYASALYRYLRQFVALYRNHSAMICQNDKYHCKLGEPA